MGGIHYASGKIFRAIEFLRRKLNEFIGRK